MSTGRPKYIPAQALVQISCWPLSGPQQLHAFVEPRPPQGTIARQTTGNSHIVPFKESKFLKTNNSNFNELLLLIGNYKAQRYTKLT